ncbi:MAG: (Fe-S)-binding protein [Chloroflexota bacterium]|nr:(Fe-S)-binding protein [Chloroflexota bacterium]MDE2969393.1 (Fe-S)-binding protein [Chloroflexota bacterium]
MARKRVSLFVTCLVDQFYPEVGEATVRLLRHLGVDVDFPEAQTCCGQVALNGGYRSLAASVARRFVEVFRDSEAIVAPSGSCVATIHAHYADLLRDEPELAGEVASLQARTYELSQYLADVLGVDDVGARLPSPVRATYHDCCHALRDLGVQSQPRKLLSSVDGLELAEMKDSAACCGFGGTFAVKFADISTAILNEKLRNVDATGADVLTAVDASCLMHMGGALRRRGARTRPLHLAELLCEGLEEPRS